MHSNRGIAWPLAILRYYTQMPLVFQGLRKLWKGASCESETLGQKSSRQVMICYEQLPCLPRLVRTVDISTLEGCRHLLLKSQEDWAPASPQ
jgi:hypothetical protein